MTRMSLFVAMLVACGVQGAAAQSLRGTIRCDGLPGIATVPLVAPFTVEISGAGITYRRPVLVADTSARSGVDERGTGRMTAPGTAAAALLLSGGATGQGYSYAASYGGPMPPAQRSFRLTGGQLWTLQGGRTINRPCEIELSRQ